MADDDDKKVKDLIAGSVDEAQLMRWFGMPSAADGVAVENAPPPPLEEDPEMVAVRERRAKAIAAVDPGMLAAIEHRLTPPDDLFRLPPPPPPLADPSIARLDMKMIENKAQIADERFYEISEEMQEDIKECTPQAMLRDLHRPEMFFDKTFHIPDPEEEGLTLDIVKEVAQAMATSWKLPPLTDPSVELREVFTELRADRAKPWTDVLKLNLPNRRVSE
ncbi:MAG TPA: hypothetical protein VGM39_21250 [Kofleriaceae bacterium]